MKITLLATLLVALLHAPLMGQPGTGGFLAGDLYLFTVAWSGISSADGAIVRIDPLSGAKTVLHPLQTSGPSRQMITYDPWRDRLLFFGGFTGNHLELYSGDAAGNVQSLGMVTVSGGARGLLTPRGDGIVYVLNPGNTSVLSYIDAQDQVHTVMNAAGTASFQFGLPWVQIQSLLYVPQTNSLLAARWSFSDPCPGIPANVTAIHRWDLSPDGSRVIAESCFWYDSNPSDWDGAPQGLSIGPGGKPLLIIGDGGNGSGSQGRIATIDLSTNTATPYSSVSFFGHHRIVGGVYSRLRGQAVVHDSVADSLRAFSPGQGGNGTTIATGLSASGSSGESAHLVEITPGLFQTGLTGDVSSLSLAAGGTQNLSLDVGAAFANSVYVTAGSLAGWTPGFPLAGTVLPLNYDGYFQFTLDFPNTPPLLNSFSLLDPQGQATISFTLPGGLPGSLAGTIVHHAAVAFGPANLLQVTNAVPLELVP